MLLFLTIEKSGKKEQKNLFHGKKKKKGNEDVDAVDSDQEETSEFVESKEVDYMSESSSGILINCFQKLYWLKRTFALTSLQHIKCYEGF